VRTEPATFPDLSRLAAAAAELLAPHTARFEALLAIAAEEHNLSPTEITSAAKTRRVMAAKRDAILLAVEFLSPPFGPEALGTWFNLSRSAMSRLLADARQRAKDDPAFAAHLDNLRPRIREALTAHPLPESSPHV
jgi:hypothetical protein